MQIEHQMLEYGELVPNGTVPRGHTQKSWHPPRERAGAPVVQIDVAAVLGGFLKELSPIDVIVELIHGRRWSAGLKGWSSPFSLTYFLFGRWVSAEAAADFAAALDLGSRNTCDAAVAACLLVTSLFERVLAMWSSCCPARFRLTRLRDGNRNYTRRADVSI